MRRTCKLGAHLGAWSIVWPPTTGGLTLTGPGPPWTQAKSLPCRDMDPK